MANYSIQRSDVASGDVTVNEATANTDTNVTLVGQNFTGYGDEIATNFLQLLENFASGTAPEANPRVPGSAAIAGQLWYDATNATLKIFDVSWKEMAPTNLGTVESASIRWNDTNGRWQEEERVRITDGGGLIVALDGTASNTLTISHNGTDAILAGAGTTDLNITGVTAVNMPSLTLTTVLDETYGGTGVIAYATGDMLYATGANTLGALTAGANGEILTLAGGVPTWASAGAGVSTLDDLTDVTAAGAGTEGMLYKSAGDWLVSTPAQLGWDNGAQDLTVANINGIAAANFINRTAPGTISGIETHTADLTMSGADINLATNDIIQWNGGADATITDNGTNLVFDGGAGAFALFQNFDELFLSGASLYVDNVAGEAVRIQATSDLASLTNYISFRNNSSTLLAQIGITSASKNTLRIHGDNSGSTPAVELVGSDANVKLDLGAIGTAVRGYNASNESSFISSVVGTSFATSRLAVYTDVDSPSVGFNETPTVTGGAGLGAAGTYVTSIDDIGRFITRTTTSNSTVEVSQMTTAPSGATFLVHNDGNGGTMTISKGTGVTDLEWVDGSGALTEGNRTLAYNSVCTLRKKGTATWQIWGNGLS